MMMIDPVDDRFMSTFVQPAEGDLDEIEELEAAATNLVNPGNAHEHALSPPSHRRRRRRLCSAVKALGGDDDVEIENSIVDGESTSLLLSYDAASANIATHCLPTPAQIALPSWNLDRLVT